MKSNFKNFAYRVTYAQNREDVILDGFFRGRNGGFYVDVGASHPRESSVTKIFYDKGWRGINIEPSKKMYDLLMQQRPEDTNLNIGVSHEPGDMYLNEFNIEGLHTFLGDRVRDVKKDARYTKNSRVKTEMRTLLSIFTENSVKKIDFMKVDVEGMEYSVLSSNDWSLYRPTVLCIEANHITKDWHKLLKVNSYVLIFSDGLNEYFIDNKAQDKPVFNYVESVLNGRLLKYDTVDYITHLRGVIELSNKKLNRVSTKLEDQRLLNKVLDQESREKERRIKSYLDGEVSIKHQSKVLAKCILKKMRVMR